MGKIFAALLAEPTLTSLLTDNGAIAAPDAL